MLVDLSYRTCVETGQDNWTAIMDHHDPSVRTAGLQLSYARSSLFKKQQQVDILRYA
jgi:hypothetical protein